MYPQCTHWVNDARCPNAHYESLGHLSSDNMIWSTALVSNSKLLECKEFPGTHKDEFIYDLLEYGIMDRMEGETHNALEEKSMWYAAMCSSFVYDHIINLEQKVGLMPCDLFVWSNKSTL